MGDTCNDSVQAMRDEDGLFSFPLSRTLTPIYLYFPKKKKSLRE